MESINAFWLHTGMQQGISLYGVEPERMSVHMKGLKAE